MSEWPFLQKKVKWTIFIFWVNFSSMLYKGKSGEWDLYVYLWSWSLTGVCCRDAGMSRRSLLGLAQYDSKCWRSHPRTQHCSTIPFPRERGPPLRAAPGLPNHQQTRSKMLLMPVTFMWISCNYQTANMGSCKMCHNVPFKKRSAREWENVSKKCQGGLGYRTGWKGLS